MARSENRYDIRNIKHLNPENILFTIFTTAELKRMCVIKIITPLMIDSLGHPLPGGLYDKRLGPITEKGDPCGTCNKNIYFCPGHFGYIELPLPVVNPIFHKIIGTILKITCFSCFKIQIPIHIKHSLTIQIKLLNCGLVTEALKIQSIVQELISRHEMFENIPDEEFAELRQFEKIAEEELNRLDGKFNLNKNIETLRNQFINNMLKEIIPRKVCMFCKEPKITVQSLKNRIILVTKTGEKSVKALESKYVTPEESRKFMRSIWLEEKEFLQQLVSVLNEVNCENPTDIFYFDVIPVPPPNVRPVNMVNGHIMENPQSGSYKQILQNTILLRAIIQVIQSKGDTSSLPSNEAKTAYSYARGTGPIEKLNYCWEEIQNDVNSLMDSDIAGLRDRIGLKQIIEKKAGVIRMHMMGKRVNFAARSVITPDPNLNIDEIGIPETFAKHLTYPVPVTTWNVEELRKMILNGPDVHPGATLVEMEDGRVIRINNDLKKQEALLKQLLTPADESNTGFKGVKMVHRHLISGDILLLNRQPTLHKPSIMAHSARILKGEKTLRLHYANCKAYNADFDGDEMNAHFPQNELARSEGYNIANVSNQYLVPKDGTPLSGLIQDHMISGVRMSLRGRFFNKDDYQQLVFQALSFKTNKIQLLKPAIIKPMELWSGKQILSTVIINIIPKDRAPINLTASSKIPAKAWVTAKPRKWRGGGSQFKNENTMSEAEVVIRSGELLVGILDKTHYGATPYSLVHCIYELYGGSYAIRLLSSFAKLFTRFLQQEGFTLGVHDILTIPEADEQRQEIIKESRKIGIEAMTTVLDLPLESSLKEIVEKINESRRNNPKLRAMIDRQYKSALDSFTNGINKACLPAGLICKFPYNNLQLMVQSGAKGSTVNTMQISCLLGQIELEGKRPPVMISGKSLPSFPMFEFAPRAGGFIDGRFMTGIQPQEFFFHCMAGREGLIDTAVKTSRSGYLQRCLIKHLEGLHVGYDMTVRDSDQSVVQFLYGEDGMDISKVQFLNKDQMPFLCENIDALLHKDILKKLKKGTSKIRKYKQKMHDWKELFRDVATKRRTPFTLFSGVIREKMGHRKISKEKICELWYETDTEVKESFRKQCERCPDPSSSAFQPDHNFGAINERLESLVTGVKFNQDENYLKNVENMLKMRAMQSYCCPGEPVGLLAAQSVGEPSTQMTLNTFHFAGRGEMNVTLGIPRLREILMMASKSIKTPSMEIPFLAVDNLDRLAENLRKTLSRVVVGDVLEKVDVTVQLDIAPRRQHSYTLKFEFLPYKCYKQDYCVNPKYIIKHMKKRFFGEMFATIKKFSKINSNVVTSEDTGTRRAGRKGAEDGDNDDDEAEGPGNLSREEIGDESSSENEVEDEEDAKATNKFKQVHDDQEPESDEEGEKKSDDEPDDNMESITIQSSDNEVIDKFSYATNYSEDEKKYLWCELTFALPLSYNKLDMTAILRSVASKSVLWEISNIRKAITYMKNGKLMLRTDGINFYEMFKYDKLLDLDKIYCNDIHKVAETYGIEAAMKIIVKEVQDVFNVYGIKVDPRHLSLIADYMTFNGTFEPLSRKGMETSASPLQQMSFESSLTFLRAAAIQGKQDSLQNPSSSLMVGRPCNVGTGSFTLLQKIPVAAHAGI